jgi:hypothetical protein
MGAVVPPCIQAIAPAHHTSGLVRKQVPPITRRAEISEIFSGSHIERAGFIVGTTRLADFAGMPRLANSA